MDFTEKELEHFEQAKEELDKATFNMIKEDKLAIMTSPVQDNNDDMPIDKPTSFLKQSKAYDKFVLLVNQKKWVITTGNLPRKGKGKDHDLDSFMEKYGFNRHQ
eukprot:10630491-Ditylum_brightwellii.AAC.1